MLIFAVSCTVRCATAKQRPRATVSPSSQHPHTKCRASASAAQRKSIAHAGRASTLQCASGAQGHGMHQQWCARLGVSSSRGPWITPAISHQPSLAPSAHTGPNASLDRITANADVASAATVAAAATALGTVAIAVTVLAAVPVGATATTAGAAAVAPNAAVNNASAATGVADAAV